MLTSSTEQPKRRKLLVSVALALVALGVLALPVLEWFGPMADGLVATRAAAQDPSIAPDAAESSSDAKTKTRPAPGAGASNPAGGNKPHPTEMVELYLPPPTAVEDMILRELRSPTELDFIETPLEDVLTYLHEYHELQIFIERSALQEEGIKLDTPVTISVKGITLEAVLRVLLRPLKLEFLIEDELLKVTTSTSSTAVRRLLTRTYPVRDLLPKRGARQAGSPRPVGGADAETPEGSDGKPAAAGESPDPPRKGPLVFGSEAPAPRSRDPRVEDELLTAIRKTVNPQSWTDFGGPGTIVYVEESGSFVIRQTWSTHQEIVELLRALRDAKALHLSKPDKE